MADGESEPARLPDGTPDGLTQFVACTSNRLDFELGELTWIPKPDDVPDTLTPGVSVLEGSTSSSATIRVGWGPFMGVNFPATIVEGELRVDSSNIGFGIGEHVGPWVDVLNRTLGENNKQLESFEVRDGKIIMTKRVVPAERAALRRAFIWSPGTPTISRIRPLQFATWSRVLLSIALGHRQARCRLCRGTTDDVEHEQASCSGGIADGDVHEQRDDRIPSGQRHGAGPGTGCARERVLWDEQADGAGIDHD